MKKKRKSARCHWGQMRGGTAGGVSAIGGANGVRVGRVVVSLTRKSDGDDENIGNGRQLRNCAVARFRDSILPLEQTPRR